jgi:hypothetical protein
LDDPPALVWIDRPVPVPSAILDVLRSDGHHPPVLERGAARSGSQRRSAVHLLPVLPSISGFRLAAVRSILRPTGSMTLLLSVAVVTTLVAAEESHPLLTAVLVDVVTIPVVAGSSPLLPTIVPADAWDLVAVA